MPVTAASIARAFMERINAHDVEGLTALMSDDHTFIDSLGKAIRGSKWVRPAWNMYFEFCPDYWVTHEIVIENGETVAIFGKAGGTIAGEHSWETPAAWKAVIRDGRVQEWRVYADNKPVYDILARQGCE
jgi:ketosteroid isomerase-like protein